MLANHPGWASNQFSSVTQSCLTFCNPMDCSMPGFPFHHQLLELAETHVLESVMPSNNLILCWPFLLLSSISPNIRVLSSEPTCSSIPAWRIPGTEESGWLTSMGSHRVRHEWSKLTVAAVVLCIRWPKYWNFSFSISSSKEYSGLISFRIDWFDLLGLSRVQEFEHYSSRASVLQGSAFFMVQLSHSYMTTGKTIALTI